MRATRQPLAAATLCGVLAAQALPDPLVLAPDGYRFHLRLDVARLRSSELWRVLSHHAEARRSVEERLLEASPLELEDLDFVQLSFQLYLPLATSGLYVHGAGLRAADVKQGLAAAREQLLREAAPTPAARIEVARLFEDEERVGAWSAWFPKVPIYPVVVDLGPGMVWMAQPAEFVRERLMAMSRADPKPLPDPALAPLREPSRCDLLVLTSDDLAVRLVNRDLLDGRGEFTALGLRVDFHPDVVVTVTGLAEHEEHASRQLVAVRERVAECSAGFAAERVTFAVAWLKRIELAASGRTVTARVRIPAREIAGIASALGVAAALRERAEAASREEVLAERRQELLREYSKIFGDDEAESRPTAPASRPAK